MIDVKLSNDYFKIQFEIKNANFPLSQYENIPIIKNEVAIGVIQNAIKIENPKEYIVIADGLIFRKRNMKEFLKGNNYGVEYLMQGESKKIVGIYVLE